MDASHARALLERIDAFARRRFRRPIEAFAAFHRRDPSIAVPRSFNEKILWRKLFDRNPLFVLLQDKLAAKKMVRDACPELEQAALLWQGDRAEAIPFDALRRPYVIKCNHGSGFNIAVRDPANADRKAIVDRARAFLALRFGLEMHERAYWPIEPRVYVEELLPFAGGVPPDDYRLTVIAGRVAYLAADTRPGGRPSTDYRDRDWNPIPAVLLGAPRNPHLAAPRSLARMIASAETLAAGLDMLRVDFYDVGGEPVFGEFTVYPLSGHIPFAPPQFDFALGAHWDIRNAHYLAAPRGTVARLYREALDAMAGSHAANSMPTKAISLARFHPAPAGA